MRYSFTVGQAGGRERIEGGYKIKKKYFEYEATIVFSHSLHYTKNCYNFTCVSKTGRQVTNGR